MGNKKNIFKFFLDFDDFSPLRWQIHLFWRHSDEMLEW